jgi:hypothetical protein
MSDLTLQDFRDLFSERLVQVLADEKKKMFVEQKLHLKKGEDNGSCLSSFAGCFANLREDGT